MTRAEIEQMQRELAETRAALQMATEILNDPAFKAKMEALLHVAFDRALRDLSGPLDEETS